MNAISLWHRRFFLFHTSIFRGKSELKFSTLHPVDSLKPRNSSRSWNAAESRFLHKISMPFPAPPLAPKGSQLSQVNGNWKPFPYSTSTSLAQYRTFNDFNDLITIQEVNCRWCLPLPTSTILTFLCSIRKSLKLFCCN